jgi:putative tryptophan/tyrosine transport system substrate-binding protein
MPTLAAEAALPAAFLIQNFSGHPKDPRPFAGRLPDASNRCTRRFLPAIIGGGTWEGAPMPGMRRRDFVALLGGAAAAWPLAAHAQQPERIRRVGVLTGAGGPNDEEAPARKAALEQGLQRAGWVEGGNLRIDYRFPAANPEATRKYAAELVALAPDVIVSSGTASMAPLLQATRIVPIVFVNVADPVGAGFVDSLARPGGNVTGFLQFEYSLSGKWVELLKEIAPRVTRVAVLRDPTVTSGIGQFAVVQSVAPSAGMEVVPINVRDPAEIERRFGAFANSANGGVIATASALAVVHRDLLVALAARHRLPAIYHRKVFVVAGGLISYGPNLIDQFGHAGGYAGRILNGEKPADLPVQAPTKYELIVNLKTAKALRLEVPSPLLARADEVIE